jgi:hypothetical protein
MSPLRHRWTAVAAASLALGALLSSCSGSDSPEPTAAHRTKQAQPSESGEPTEPTSGPTTRSTPPPASLAFSPKSGGKHLDDCQRLVPGDDPAEFLYYPVVVTPSSDADLDTVTTVHTDGVVEAGSWVAPVTATPETGTFKGWPPKFVANDPNLQWSRRVAAAGSTLAAGTTYNVFLRLQVDPTPGDSEVNGLVFTFHPASHPASHTASGSQTTATWKATTTFSMDC